MNIKTIAARVAAELKIQGPQFLQDCTPAAKVLLMTAKESASRRFPEIVKAVQTAQ